MSANDLFAQLAKRPEGDILDFKEAMYDLSSNGRYDLIKDVICLANTPRDGSAYIVLGVRWTPGEPHVMIGLQSQIDDAKLLDQLGPTKIIPSPPAVRYHPITHGGKQFGIIEILPEPQVGPFFSSEDTKEGGLYRDGLYTRVGSKNTRAAGHQQKRVWQWFSAAPSLDSSESEQWTRLLDATESLDDSRNYILVCDRLDFNGQAAVAAMAGLPWVAVIDCDPSSENGGVLDAARESWGHHRSTVMGVKGDRHTVHPRTQVTWFFARGLAGRAGTEVESVRNKWLASYGREIGLVLEHLSKAIYPTPITIMVLWRQAQTAWMVEKILDAATEAFGESRNVVVITNEERIEAIGTDRGATAVHLDLSHLAGGVQHVLKRRRMSGSAFALPTNSGAPCPIDDRDRLWLEEELQLVHLDSAAAGSDGPEAFRRGGAVTWRDLDNHYDCDRTTTGHVLDRVYKDLESRVTTRINVLHPAGAGGSTVARRVAWAMHDRFPTVLLLSISGAATAARLAKIASATGSTILCLVDASLLRPSEIDDLFRLIRSEQTSVVFLQVTRRPQKPMPLSHGSGPQRSFWLDLPLDAAEAERFRAAYSLAVPLRSRRFKELAESTDFRERTAFYFGLTAYGRDFGGLRAYVAARLENLTDVQRRTVGYLAIAHHYGQQGLSEQAFAQLLGMPRDRSLDLSKFLPHETMELLVPGEDDSIRTAHNLIAEEVLQQLLSPGDDTSPEAWRQQLSAWAMDFAKFLRSDAQLPGDLLVDLASRVFVLRDNSEMIGTESAADKRFSRLIEDIPSVHGQIAVLKGLTEIFPNESHFHAHLGRFLGLAGHVDEAIQSVIRAVELSPEDPVLHHMCGMAHRYKMRALIDQESPLNEVVAVAKQAQEAFGASREHNPEDEHSYVSEVQTICRVLDYATKQNKGNRIAVVISSNDSFIREGLQRAEDLMDQLRTLRGADRPSNFEIDCRSRLDLFYGDDTSALQGWQSILDRPGSVKPPVRRQIVWTLLRRADDDWSKMRNKDIERCKELLRANVEDSLADASSMRLWLRAVRYGQHQPNLNTLIERVGYWRANTGSLDATFYHYVLHTLAAFEGSVVSLDDAAKALEDCRRLARGRRSRTWSFEWLGHGKGISALVHQSALGEWKEDFYSDVSKLARVSGRVSSISAAQQGEIELSAGIRAFFVPAKADIQPNRDENAQIECYVGFSYDGLRAWQVVRKL